jgi:hypothetical protein
VYMYSARPAEFVSQIPALPEAVFKASVEPEAVELGAVELGAVELGAVELGAAEAVAVGLVVVEPAAAVVLEELLQAVASIATPASGRLRPSVRSGVLRNMTILPM